MEIIVHRANSRGHYNHGWLQTSHTFSFAEYFDPDRVHFGALRVLNDDVVSGGEGFDMHSHHNMEIVSIPLKGELLHDDSMGNRHVLRPGEIQVMSAGTGIRHSEYNHCPSDYVEFLQIWVVPDKQEVMPRYHQGDITHLLRPNELRVIVSPYPGAGKEFWVHQQAWFSYGQLDRETEIEYRFKSDESFGVYVFVIEGGLLIDNIELGKRDGMGITRTDRFTLLALEPTTVLLMEVPPLR